MCAISLCDPSVDRPVLGLLRSGRNGDRHAKQEQQTSDDMFPSLLHRVKIAHLLSTSKAKEYVLLFN